LEAGSTNLSNVILIGLGLEVKETVEEVKMGFYT
jgi:hypothetical protein